MKFNARWHDGLLACAVMVFGLPALADPTLEGIVVDHTFTGSGRAIFVAFVRRWQEEGFHPEGNLTVQEQPAPRGGTEIVIESDHRLLFRGPGSGTRADPDLFARVAVNAVARQLSIGSGQSYVEVNGRDELR